ncbi:MAG: 23S rRNA (uracil(1939)-C(5))-methyltransferase RlmD [Bacteroidales bacterium]|nr:23S rRNA (uracil(1939)-C(5))-methyltransferase RlmD [Bacteroidales bacterium]MCM1417053.1 23S rRNA (uracil(1939)-C(5))-methyltransferase RlmD [bacterium]MCM1424126.1 23S rRNA (uracil(1939)-C(5))-methyltransferase RlmD [bacterium]
MGKEAGTEKRRTNSRKEGKADGGRRQSLCPVSDQCGGCRFVDMPYKEQIRRKQRQAEQLLKEYGRVMPMIAMEEPAHYRNKVHAVFAFQKGRGIVSGIYQEKSHRVISVENCLLEDRKAGEIIQSIRQLARSFKLKAYDEDSGYGLLRHVLIRVGHVTGEIMVVLVLSSPILPAKKHFVEELCKLHPEITTILINVNNKHTSMVLGEKEQVVYGKGYIEDELCGRRFRISAKSFYQVNSRQTEALYAKAAEYAQLTGKETVVDAYCGIGTIALAVAGQAGKVIGVELNQDAVRDAVTNARRNQIKNADFYLNDAGRFLTQMANAGEKVDVVFLDPPRSGSTEEFLDALIRILPERVVYISCEPETLARDLKYLTAKSDYRVREMTPVDMFPFTEHIETVCLLHRKRQ